MQKDVKNLSTTYNAREVEKEIYKFWEDNEFFKANSQSDKPPFQ